MLRNLNFINLYSHLTNYTPNYYRIKRMKNLNKIKHALETVVEKTFVLKISKRGEF